jgi:hypothetical protein
VGALTTPTANAVIDHVNGVAAFTEPTAPLKVRLMTANGSAASAGTEVAGGLYTAQTIAMGSASAGSAANTNAISFTGMPACTVVGIEIWDSNGSPVRRWWGAVSASKTYGAGDTATIAIGAVTVSLT